MAITNSKVATVDGAAGIARPDSIIETRADHGARKMMVVEFKFTQKSNGALLFPP